MTAIPFFCHLKAHKRLSSTLGCSPSQPWQARCWLSAAFYLFHNLLSVVRKTPPFSYLLHLKREWGGWLVSHCLMEICNDRSRYTSLLLHSSTFALTFRFHSHMPKDVAPNSSCSFSENYFLNCFKPKYQAAEWLQSKPLVSLSSPHYYQKLLITVLGSTPSFSRETERNHGWGAFVMFLRASQKVYDCVSRHCCLQRSGVAFPALL